MTHYDPKALRKAFGSFMTGVTVVTTRDQTGTPYGFTANSFTSVSLDPPMVLVCPGKFLSSYDAFAGCTHFAVNILAEGQEAASNVFARFKGDRFAQVAHRSDAFGTPLIDGAVAQFSCSTDRVIEAGDHAVLLGRVEAFGHQEKRGLGYAGGQYFSLGLERGDPQPAPRDLRCGAIIECDGHVLLQNAPSGYHPPQIVRSTPRGLRSALEEHLARAGIAAQLGPVYSAFEDAQAYRSYILGRATCPPTDSDLTLVPIKDLPRLRYVDRPLGDMMARFAEETETRDFSFYLGDAQMGETHHLSQRS